MRGVVQVGILYGPTLRKISECGGGLDGGMYLKLGLVLCVFMTSAERSRNTHTLCNVSHDLQCHTSISIPRTHDNGVTSQNELL